MKHSWENQLRSYNAKAVNPRNAKIIVRVCTCRECGAVRVQSIIYGNSVTDYLQNGIKTQSAGDCKSKIGSHEREV